MPLYTIDEAVAALQEGRMIILVDDPKWENEGSLLMAAEKVTPDTINFMATYARGLICLPMAGSMIEALDLPPMAVNNTSAWQNNFTISIEAREGVTTGISAADRATTILAAVADDAKPSDLVRPGHIFPLHAHNGGVMVRVGATEGAVDLTAIAGLKPAGVICKIMSDDGNMARRPELEQFSETHDIGIVAIADIIAHRMRRDKLVRKVAAADLPLKAGGTFHAVVYENDLDDYQHIALVKGTVDSDQPILVRVHSECFTGDILRSMRCDCGSQMHHALELMEKEGRGVFLYVRQEGRGIGLINKLKAYNLQDDGLDTVEANERLGFDADLRDYGVGAQVLVDIGVRKMRLITNNPKKIVGLEGYGLSVTEQVPVEIPANPYNQCYLECKKLKLGHLLNIENGND